MRESIDGPDAGGQQLGDDEKSLINGMCNVSTSTYLFKLGILLIQKFS